MATPLSDEGILGRETDIKESRKVRLLVPEHVVLTAFPNTEQIDRLNRPTSTTAGMEGCEPLDRNLVVNLTVHRDSSY